MKWLMCWHRWSKWEQYTKQFLTSFMGSKETETREFQRRKCSKCGKVEVKRIYG